MRLSLVLLLLAGCGRIRFDVVGAAGDAAGDGSGDAPVDACAFGPWGAPSLLATVNSTDSDESAALEGDGLTMVFQSDRPTAGLAHLYQATRSTTAASFGSVAALSTVNGTMNDVEPTLSADGLTLYFTSDRSGAFRLYRATRPTPSGAFGAPVMVPELASTLVTGASLSSDGSELFFVGGGAVSIYRATYDASSGFTVVGPVPELAIGTPNGFTSLDPDGLTIYLQAVVSPATAGDIYMATRPAVGASFGAPVLVAAVSDPVADDGDPEISKDGRTMIFASNRAGGPGMYDLYSATRACQ